MPTMNLDSLAMACLGYGHTVRLRCLVLLEAEHSPSELCELLQTTENPPTLGTTAYHMRMLRQYGLVTETRTETRRGALEHYYLRTETADRVIAALGPLMGIPKRPPGRQKTGAREAALLTALGGQPVLAAAA